MSFALYEVTKHQHVQEKILQEVNQVLGNKEPSFEDIPNLVYCRAVIDETLRMHGPVRQVFKLALEDDYFDEGTTLIPKGTILMPSLYANHYDPQYWENPTQFNPDRFDPRSSQYKSAAPFTYVPFSFGSRNCIGSRFSLVSCPAPYLFGKKLLNDGIFLISHSLTHPLSILFLNRRNQS